jgi:hypothetical protein
MVRVNTKQPIKTRVVQPVRPGGYVPGGGGGGGGDPFESLRTSLFGASEQGLWARPDQYNAPLTQYKESTAQNIVTAVGDTVGLAIDWRLGRTLGAERMPKTGGWVDADWVKDAHFVISGGNIVVDNTGQGSQGFCRPTVDLLTAGKWYEITANVSSVTTLGQVSFRLLPFSGSVGAITGPNLVAGQNRWFVQCTGSLVRPGLRCASSASLTQITINEFTCKELPGNHAYQATASKRPLLAGVPPGGRNNELIQTENFAAASWVKIRLSVTGEVCTVNSTNASGSVLTQGSLTAGVVYTCYADMKYNDSRWCAIRIGSERAWFDLLNGVVGTKQGAGSVSSITDVGNGYYRCRFTHTPTTTVLYVYPATDGDNTDAGTLDRKTNVARVQLQRGSSATNYQRVGAGIYDVTEEGQPTLYGWLSDGVDDNLETNAFDPGTDKVTVCAGVRKLSDAATAVVIEHSVNFNTNNGTFGLLGPSNPSLDSYQFRSKGTTLQGSAVTGFAAPVSNVITGLGDIAGDIARIRINGTQVAETLTDQGTGNYGNHKAYIGGRAGTSLFYNGYIFALCLRFAATDSSLLSRLENFVAVKTLGARL